MCSASCRTPSERPRPRSVGPMACGSSTRWNAGCSSGRHPRSVGYDRPDRPSTRLAGGVTGMEHDDRDRRDWPAQDADGPPSGPNEATAPDAPTEPIEPTESVERREDAEPGADAS